MIYHGSYYRSNILRPGIYYTKDEIFWDETESNRYLYATTNRDTAIEMGFASALTQVGLLIDGFIVEDYNIKIYTPDFINIDIIDRMINTVYLYEIDKDLDIWDRVNNPYNGISDEEYKTDSNVKPLNIIPVNISKWLKKNNYKIEIINSNGNENQMVIFGEAHYVPGEVSGIISFIREFKPNVVVLEHLYSDVIMNSTEAKAMLDEGDPNVVVPGFSKEYIELAHELNIPFIGADLELVVTDRYDYRKYIPKKYWNITSDGISNLTLKQHFFLREKVMLGRLKEVRSKFNGRIVAVFGDTHLRTISTPELGPVSPIYNEYKDDLNVKIIRSNHGEIR